MANKVCVIMGSDSDWDIVKNAVKALMDFGVQVEAHVISAHRTPEEAAQLASGAEKNGISVFIAAAGLSAHLAGVLAAHTTLPVIGIPIANGAVQGIDALFSTVNMPPGVPVATVGIDAAKNAGLLAVQMLALGDAALREKLRAYKNDMAQSVAQKDEKLQSLMMELRS